VASSLGQLVVFPSLAVARDGERLVLTNKFIEGMAAYARGWPGPVRAAMHLAATGGDSLDGVSVRPANLPFGVDVVDYRRSPLHEVVSASSLVVAGPDYRLPNLAAICRRAGTPFVLVTENNLHTRLQIGRLQRRSTWSRLRNAMWELDQERRTRRSVRLATSVQCNGIPTFAAYRSIATDPLLYFDTRTTQDLLPDAAEIAQRTQRLQRGEPLRLAFSGRLNAIKGVDFLVPVAVALRAMNVPFQFTVYGDGDLLPAMRRQVEAAGLGASFHFAGVLDFRLGLIPAMRREADLFVCCHRQGDPSCTYMETLSCGVPIVGFDNAAWRGMLGIETVGWSVAMDDVDAMAATIAMLHRQRELLARTSEAAWRWGSANAFERTFARRVEHYLAAVDHGHKAAGGPTPATARAGRLPQRYLLAVNMPVYCWDGGHFVEDLWLYDLRRHLEHIDDLTLLCPLVHGKPPASTARIPTDGAFARLRLVGVPYAPSTWRAFLLAPAHFVRIWRAVGKADIVHDGAVGWPIPLGYYSAVAAWLRRRFHLVIMESSPWRLVPGQRARWSLRLRCFLMERLARWVARHSQLALFTSNAYRQSMVPAAASHAHVFKAAWITADHVIDAEANAARWQARLQRSTPHLIAGFAGRLCTEKGVQVLLAALAQLPPTCRCVVQVLGDGELAGQVRAAAAAAPPHLTIEYLGRVDYGEPFFAVLDQWDVTLVPSLTDEQPRIVYDSFARGVPIVASRTTALAECITEGEDGLLFQPGDSRDLAAVLTSIAGQRDRLLPLAVGARLAAAQRTHERMHADRQQMIETAWRSWRARGSG
jgi:glycosyltransferase involved in cell wall biosynthesis